jgi:hypothetical protein
MSEYQYYEFQAIDRPLTRAEMDELRAISTRATITSTRFTNVYHFGDFKGDPLTLMRDYFDMHVYVANWGTHYLMIRLPREALNLEAVSPYCPAHGAELHTTERHLIFDFLSDDEEGSWSEWDESGEEWLPSLLPLRTELADGDLRALYLAWLACAWSGELEENAPEPPVPAGLGSLTAAQSEFVKFLRLDQDLLAVAIEQSTEHSPAPPSPGALKQWIQDLPESEKNNLLVRLVDGSDVDVRTELRRRYRRAKTPPISTASEAQRTVGDLLAEAEQRAEARRRQDAERDAAERARREQRAARERAKYLEDLATREETVWRSVDELIETKQQTNYDQAVSLILDLRDVNAWRKQPHERFTARLNALRARHAKKTSLISRLDDAGLRGG